MDQGKAKAEALTTSVDKLDRKAKQMGPYRIGLEVPQLNPLFSRVQQFGSILDGLDGRHIQIYVDSKYSGPAGGLGASNRSGIDSGEMPGRGMTNDNRVIINGDVKPQNFREFEREMRGKQRARSGGGR